MEKSVKKRALEEKKVGAGATMIRRWRLKLSGAVHLSHSSGGVSRCSAWEGEEAWLESGRDWSAACCAPEIPLSCPNWPFEQKQCIYIGIVID